MELINELGSKSFIIYKSVCLVVEIKTAHIYVAASYCGDGPVHDQSFRVEKPLLVEIHMNSSLDKLLEVGVGYPKGYILIRYSRHHQMHLHPRERCSCKSVHNSGLRDKIGTLYVNLVVCVMNKPREHHPQAVPFGIGTAAYNLHGKLDFSLLRLGEKPGIIHHLSAAVVPIGEKNSLQHLHGLSLNPYHTVPPAVIFFAPV